MLHRKLLNSSRLLNRFARPNNGQRAICKQLVDLGFAVTEWLASFQGLDLIWTLHHPVICLQCILWLKADVSISLNRLLLPPPFIDIDIFVDVVAKKIDLAKVNMKGFACTSLILRTSLKFVMLNFVVGYSVKRTAGI